MSILFRPADWPIAVKLLLAFLFIALVPLVVVGLLSQSQAREGLLTEAKRNLENTSRRTSASIDDFIKSRATDLQQTTTLDSVTRFINLANNDRDSLGPNNFDQSSVFNILKSKANSSINNYFVIASKSGQVELTSNTSPSSEGGPLEGEPRDLTDQKYFQEAMKGLTFISDPKVLSFTDRGVQSVMYISSPVRDIRANPVGVIVERFNLDGIWQIINNDYEAAGPGSYTMLVDDTNGLGIRIGDSRIYNRADLQTTLLFGLMRPLPSAGRGPWVNSGRFPDQFDYQKAVLNGQGTLPGLTEVLNRPGFDKANPFFSLETNNGDQKIPLQVAYATIPAKPKWSYYVIVPEATYAAAANNITTTLLLVVGLAVVVVILLALVLARLLTTPVRRISRVLGRIGIGDFEARVPVRGRDELGRLGESLNAMFDNTLTLIQSREEKEVLQDRITTLLEEISTVAEGDLTVQAEVTADITGAIADSFNLMIEELRKIIINIQNATGQTSTYFEQVVVNSQQIDRMSDRQAARVLTVSSSVEDMNRSIQQVSDAASVSANVAQEARQNARQGGLAVTQTIAGMNRIRGNVQDTAKKIKRLGESSQQISEIVKLIDDIADQTNMLALNAAIQAAMAGEQGKGFSVVSEEVRRLAERSANATREIAALVKSIQDDTAEAVVAMEESTREVVEGSKVADDAGRALIAIENVVERLATLITNISVVSRQQAGSSVNIARSMVELSDLTQEAAALRRQSSEAVEVVARTADELRVSVSAFKVEDGRALPAQAGRPSEPMILEARQVAPPQTEVPAIQPEYYQFLPSTSELTFGDEETYNPAADGGSWPNSSNPAGPGQLANGNRPAYSSRPVAQTHDAGLDFDLNSLLGDDPVFDTFFDESARPNSAPARSAEEGSSRRPPALG